MFTRDRDKIARECLQASLMFIPGILDIIGEYGSGIEGRCIGVLQSHTAAVNAIVPITGGFASASSDKTIRIWRFPDSFKTKESKNTPLVDVLVGHTGGVVALAVLPGGLLVSGSWDATIRIWKYDEKERPRLFGADDASAKHWVADGAMQILRDHSKSISALVALPDGRLVSGSNDKTIRIWERVADDASAKHWVAASKVIDQGSVPLVLALSPSGLLVAGYDTGLIRFWNAKLECVRELSDDPWDIAGMAVMNDVIVSISFDLYIRVWLDADDAKYVPMLANREWPASIAALPNGQVVAGFHDNAICVIDAAEHKILQKLVGHTTSVVALAALPGGLVSGSSDGTICVWE